MGKQELLNLSPPVRPPPFPFFLHSMHVNPNTHGCPYVTTMSSFSSTDTNVLAKNAIPAVYNTGLVRGRLHHYMPLKARDLGFLPAKSCQPPSNLLSHKMDPIVGFRKKRGKLNDEFEETQNGTDSKICSYPHEVKIPHP
ncbi:unnamed protein product [Dovyalis caffra]|uniref:Uncharacterized protein n=1 Tax=Dovyalis caffra TaxID=77055 RepID=A0AAV1RP89_9ROSI|nr:unnamed protein product [Dovyalis caffra]